MSSLYQMSRATTCHAATESICYAYNIRSMLFGTYNRVRFKRCFVRPADCFCFFSSFIRPRFAGLGVIVVVIVILFKLIPVHVAFRSVCGSMFHFLFILTYFLFWTNQSARLKRLNSLKYHTLYGAIFCSKLSSI